jgi:hypothetical protein
VVERGEEKQVMGSRNDIWFRKGIHNRISVVQMGNKKHKQHVVQKSDRNRSSVVQAGDMKQQQRVIQIGNGNKSKA